ncbi:MAG: DHH family phosphoesterase [bacterium]|jgi:phosphoesterase RecJ-like protein
MTIENIASELSAGKNIVITTHHKPDGDAMGSSLGLYHFLCALGHNVHVITPTDYPYFLHWMPGHPEVINFMENEAKAAELVASADWIFCTDFNNLTRINELGDLVRQSKAKKAMIDHHLEPEGFEDFRYWDTTSCAAAELVYRFIAELGQLDKLSKEAATCLYTGIMTDTGSFRFASTTASVHRIIADLIELGADNSRIHELIYDTNSENRLKFLGEVLSNRMVVLKEKHTAYISIDKDLLKKYDIRTGDTEGVVNYALSIHGIKLAVLVIDRGELRKLSFRSKAEFPANEVAKKYFSGGGHRNAAGGSSMMSLEDTVAKFLEVLPEYEYLLNE